MLHKIDFAISTDANGWEVTSYGTSKVFTKHIDTRNGGAWTSAGFFGEFNTPLPVGYAATQLKEISVSYGNSGVAQLAIQREQTDLSHTNDSTTFTFWVRSGSLSVNQCNLWIDYVLKTK